jgi:hypothetical protein
MHVAFVRIFQSYLKKIIIDSLSEHENYIEVKIDYKREIRNEI